MPSLRMRVSTGKAEMVSEIRDTQAQIAFTCREVL